MKQQLTIIFSLLLLVLLSSVSCSHEEVKIANQEDYQIYLEADPTEDSDKLEEQLSFWNNRIKADSSQIIDLNKSAGVYTAIFQTNADINSLKLAEQNLEKGVEKAAIGKDNYLRALAQNYVTQHRFREAKKAIDSATAISGDISANNFVRYDIAMELGNYEEAKTLLDEEADFSNYNYLIRLAKWEDYQGNLDKTIQHMENAMRIAERGNTKALKLWVYTNLADYYGHAGEIKKSYNHYLKALELDPNNAYAKKGIAWIAYSHDRNPKEALRIIEKIESTSKSPDYLLLKAEIQEDLGNSDKAKNLTEEFLERVSNIQYGDMYGAYLVEVYASNENTAPEALELAKKEVRNRPTPMSYDLLAHAYYANGEYEKALEVAEEFVIGKTYEPLALFHTAQIYKALGLNDRLAPIKEELLETSYELGPVMYQEIKNF